MEGLVKRRTFLEEACKEASHLLLKKDYEEALDQVEVIERYAPGFSLWAETVKALALMGEGRPDLAIPIWLQLAEKFRGGRPVIASYSYLCASYCQMLELDTREAQRLLRLSVESRSDSVFAQKSREVLEKWKFVPFQKDEPQKD